jgi:hypothetical protein|tara:strand:+ start:681 stop:1841 length:1161 start_codon:yes stop_codon:yes gene_type:complete
MAKRKAKNVYLMPEPKWSELALIKDEVKQHKMIRDMEYFVHYEVADKKCSATVMHWLEKDSGLDLELIKKLKRVPDVWFSTFAKHTFIWHKTGVMLDEVRDHLLEKIPPLEEKAEAIIEKLEEKKADAKPKISIQQRMIEQITDLCGTWEALLDGYIVADNFDNSSFDPEKDMKIYNGGVIKPAHAKIIKDQYQPVHTEAIEMLAGTCEQLNEAYDFMNKKTKKAYVQYFEKIMNACDAIILTGKATRKTRQPKARSKDVIVKKMKFQVADGTLGIASITPTDVVYANEVWIYNTKSRKIGVYHASNKDPKSLGRAGAGLMVKGTSIIGYDLDASMQKTLRKPAEQISNWTGNAKTKFNKAFEEVKTTPTKLTGRLNDTTIILKAF